MSENQPLVHSVQSVDKGEVDKKETVETVIIDGKAYTSSKLNLVIQWLKENPDKAHLTVREIAAFTGVSKSWVAIAKKHSPISSEA